MLKRVGAGHLEVAYKESGSDSGKLVILLHGFTYRAVAQSLQFLFHLPDFGIPLYVSRTD